MNKIINDLFELDKLIGNELLIESELPKDCIINGLSVRGPELLKYINDKLYLSPNLNDTVLIFECSHNKNNCLSEYNEINDELILFNSFEYKVILYGNHSKNIASKLKARFESDSVKQHLYDEGIYLEYVDYPESINEIINETVWIRTDLSINLSCQMKFNSIKNELNFDKINKITLIKEEN